MTLKQFIRNKWRRFLHRFHGCAKYNRTRPTWIRTEPYPDDEPHHTGPYPCCGMCNGPAWWMWGYRKQPPDLVAIRRQGSPPGKNDAHYCIRDGYLDFLPKDLADLVCNEYEKHHKLGEGAA